MSIWRGAKASRALLAPWDEARKRERVRCSPLVLWPVYPRLRRIVQGSKRARNVDQGRCSRPGPTKFTAPKDSGE